MDGLINSLDAFLGDFFNIAIPDMHITDLIEIVIIAAVLYNLFVWFKASRAWTLLKGILVILMFFFVAAVLQMNTILWLGKRLISVALISIVIVFQPELRYALEHLGRNNMIAKILPMGWNRSSSHRFEDKTLNALVKACFDMGAVKTGALIVIEKDIGLTEYERTGIELDSILSRQLLINIFEKNTPLHDGAIIVRGDRVVSATCYLPLSDSLTINKDLGTRHRAAIGISEVSDAVTIVVSEETGGVSVTEDGQIYRDLDEQGLRTILQRVQETSEKAEEKQNDDE